MPIDLPELGPPSPRGALASRCGCHEQCSSCSACSQTVVAVAAIATFVERRIYAGRVLPGVEVDGVSSSGHAEQYVYDEVTPARHGAGGRTGSGAHRRPGALGRSLAPRAAGRRAAPPRTAAFEEGRHGGLLSQLAGTVRRWVRPDHVPLHVVYDDDRLEGMLDGWSAGTGNPAVEGGLRFEGSRVVPIEPRSGTGILRAEARAALVRMLAGPDRPVVTLPVGTIHPAARRRRGRCRGRGAPARCSGAASPC